MGILYLELGLLEHASEQIEAALRIHRETGSRWSLAETLVYAGLLKGSMRQYQSAFRLTDQAIAIAQNIGAKYIEVKGRNAKALLLCERNQPGDASKALDEATFASEMTREANLVVGEIPSLSRSARATSLLGNLEAARALSRRAVELLAEQRVIESSEEEIYYTYYRILTVMQDPAALDYLEKCHSGLMAKMATLENPEWRDAFAENVPLNAAIRRDYLLIHRG
jgi:tetratricopeptide (TPR) repeat protein